MSVTGDGGADLGVYRDAVQGAVGGEDVGETVAAAAEQYPNALFHHGQTERLEPQGQVPHGEESTALGIDLKRTPDGDWTVIELMPNSFGKTGYDDAYQWGSVYGETNPSRHGTPFTDYLWALRDKENAHEVIDGYMADLVPVDQAGSADTERVVVKDPERDGGQLVSIHHRTEFTGETESPVPERFRNDRIVEEFVPSQDVMHDGEAYDACMRYAVNLDLDADGLTVTDLGGYWRTAAEPEDADAGLDARHLANLSRGHPVPATFAELDEASRTTHDVVADLYRDFLDEQGGRSWTSPDAQVAVSDIGVWSALGAYHLTGDVRLQAAAAAGLIPVLHGVARLTDRDPVPDGVYERLGSVTGQKTAVQRSGIRRDREAGG